MAEPQRDLTPEQAAQRLRDLPDIHYLNVSASETVASSGAGATNS